MVLCVSAYSWATMDVSPDAASSALISESAEGSLDVKLHPLVIINASEHFTRLCAQSGKRHVRSTCAV